MTATSVERLGTLIKCETKCTGVWWFLSRGEKKKKFFLNERECSEEQHFISSIFVTFESTFTFETKIGKYKKKKKLTLAIRKVCLNVLWKGGGSGNIAFLWLYSVKPGCVLYKNWEQLLTSS